MKKSSIKNGLHRIYEELLKNADDFDKETIRTKLQEADLNCKKAMSELLLSAHTIITQ